MPSTTAILDRFLHHAEIIQITGKSYRLRNQSLKQSAEPEERRAAQAAILENSERSKAAKGVTGCQEQKEDAKAAKVIIAGKRRG